MNLKGGVVLIGSLFWQDHRDKADDNIRKKWREDKLDLSLVRDVRAPIRYGRRSMGGCYTMIFDNQLPPEKYGTARLVPFKNLFENTDQIIKEARKLSQIEGRGDDYLIKCTKYREEYWCACAILVNPDLYNKDRLLNSWSKAIEYSPDPHGSKEDLFSELNRYSITRSGELDISWPHEAKGYDFLLATATRNNTEYLSGPVPVEELVKNIDKREYFDSNQENGITTFQDEEITKSRN